MSGWLVAYFVLLWIVNTFFCSWLAAKKIPFICFSNHPLPIAGHLFVASEAEQGALNS